MNNSNRGKAFLQEFKDFLIFLQNLWGILAGVSVFFPLSNVLIKLIPMKTISEDGVFVHISPALVTTIATIVTLFVVLWTFGNRHRLKSQGSLQRIRRKAWISFGVGLLSLVSYLVVYFVTYQIAWESWGWSSDDPRRLLVEIILLATYSMFFALITRAFMLLGMSEFFAPDN
jgi:uncharacterized membrane protein YdbT with pleckstrin-like domain